MRRTYLPCHTNPRGAPRCADRRHENGAARGRRRGRLVRYERIRRRCQRGRARGVSARASCARCPRFQGGRSGYLAEWDWPTCWLCHAHSRRGFRPRRASVRLGSAPIGPAGQALRPLRGRLLRTVRQRRSGRQCPRRRGAMRRIRVCRREREQPEEHLRRRVRLVPVPGRSPAHGRSLRARLSGVRSIEATRSRSAEGSLTWM